MSCPLNKRHIGVSMSKDTHIPCQCPCLMVNGYIEEPFTLIKCLINENNTNKFTLYLVQVNFNI